MTGQPVGVVVSSEQPRKGNGKLPAYAAPYIGEILRHAGIPFALLPPDALADASAAPRLLILAQDLDLSADEKAGAAAFVDGGGMLIGIAGTSGLDDLFGVQTDGQLDEGYLQPPGDPHPVTAGLRREIHVFGGSRVTATAGVALSQVTPIGQTNNAAVDAVVTHASGRGRTLLVAPDLITSVCHIQQGKPVVPEAPREAAGTPSGSILDSVRDGDVVDIDSVDDLYYSHASRGEDGLIHYNRRILLTPMADVLRELLLRAIFNLFSSAGEPLPVLWYWPRGLASIAHMSHDSDGNRQKLGWSLYELLRELELPSTWCTMPVPVIPTLSLTRSSSPLQKSRCTTPPATRRCGRTAAGARWISTGNMTCCVMTPYLADHLQQKSRSCMARPPGVLLLVSGQGHST